MTDAHQDGQAAARHAAVIAELLARIQTEVTGAAALVDVAEDEIDQAAARHPQAADDLFHSFTLLLPAFEARAWGTEFVLRAHCRELLEREILVDFRPKAGVRFSPHFYNQIKECDFAIEQVDDILRTHAWEKHATAATPA